MTITATGSTVRNAVAAAKRLLGNPRLRAISINDDHADFGLYRVVLNSGDVVEVTTRFHATATAEVLR